MSMRASLTVEKASPATAKPTGKPRAKAKPSPPPPVPPAELGGTVEKILAHVDLSPEAQAKIREPNA